MASLGLLGAIGGLGKGLTDLGSDLARRREQALENARRMAEEQRKSAERKQERGEDRAFDLEKTGILQDRQDARTSATLAARSQINEDNQNFRRTERIEGQDFKSGEGDRKFEQQKELAKLRGSVAKDVSTQGIRLRDKLAQDDTAGIRYGKPDKDGYAEVIRIRKDGKTENTHEKVYQPKLDYKEDLLDDEEDEEDEDE